MATKKLKLEEEAISEILVADTDSESGAEVSDVEENLKKKKKVNNNNMKDNNYYCSKPQLKTNHRLQQVAEDYHPADRLKEGIQMFFLSSFQQKVWKKWGSTHQQRQLATVCVDVVFHRNFSSAGGTDQLILRPTTSSRKFLWQQQSPREASHCGTL